MKALLPADRIEQQIRLIRGHRVMLDRDLAKIYGVSTSRLNVPGPFLALIRVRFLDKEWRTIVMALASGAVGYGVGRRIACFAALGCIVAGLCAADMDAEANAEEGIPIRDFVVLALFTTVIYFISRG